MQFFLRECQLQNTSVNFLSADVIQMLETSGKVTVKDGSVELLKRPLRCHRCPKECPTMPALKEHLRSHSHK